jgi:hypothetical protein
MAVCERGMSNPRIILITISLLLLAAPAGAAECLRSPGQVRAVHGKQAWPVWRMRVAGHVGKKCWQAGERKKVKLAKSKKPKIWAANPPRQPEKPRPVFASLRPDGALPPPPARGPSAFAESRQADNWHDEWAHVSDMLYRPLERPLRIERYQPIAFDGSMTVYIEPMPPERDDEQRFGRALLVLSGLAGAGWLARRQIMTRQHGHDEAAMQATLRNLRLAPDSDRGMA